MNICIFFHKYLLCKLLTIKTKKKYQQKKKKLLNNKKFYSLIAKLCFVHYQNCSEFNSSNRRNHLGFDVCSKYRKICFWFFFSEKFGYTIGTLFFLLLFWLAWFFFFKTWKNLSTVAKKSFFFFSLLQMTFVSVKNLPKFACFFLFSLIFLKFRSSSRSCKKKRRHQKSVALFFFFLERNVVRSDRRERNFCETDFYSASQKF